MVIIPQDWNVLDAYIPQEDLLLSFVFCFTALVSSLGPSGLSMYAYARSKRGCLLHDSTRTVPFITNDSTNKSAFVKLHTKLIPGHLTHALFEIVLEPALVGIAPTQQGGYGGSDEVLEPMSDARADKREI